MFYALELLICVGVLLYIFWKYLIPKQQSNKQEYKRISNHEVEKELHANEEETFVTSNTVDSTTQQSNVNNNDNLNELTNSDINSNETKEIIIEFVTKDNKSGDEEKTVNTAEYSIELKEQTSDESTNDAAPLNTLKLDKIQEEVVENLVTEVKNEEDLNENSVDTPLILDHPIEVSSIIADKLVDAIKEPDNCEEVTNLKDDILSNNTQTVPDKNELVISRIKRESPPREKFAEFIENTILRDDKIQSLIQNLSLDTEVTVKPLDNTSESFSKENCNNDSGKDDNTVKIQVVVPLVDKDNASAHAEQESYNAIDTKPILKRLHKNPGFPAGLNFGSVIGELKNKTKNSNNGALKPVFRKFEIDNNDNEEACIF